ncbi:PREDICTED: uncharacterized protein LOC105958340 [Erythranthe guttata]|uniref:uncharacterized protein LOC105958340 n=1 Tax=Erythranthe guttata TaxID=4155 RepID=UPI00064D96C7|nr:PREDICTED: uncharacterized protein LOC105958340 [Erythranthe guttata]|eukprot:XP_012837804.1 PREDICTED: uncharacterized protein LOC105958340 [Erythranthe guttata]
MASPPRNPLPAVGDVHNDAAAPEPADPNLAVIVHPVNLEAMPISFIESGDELNPIDPDNFEYVGPSSSGRRGGRGGRTPVRENPPRGLHLVDEDTDDEEVDPTFAEPEAQALSSSSTESSSNDSTPPASTQGETSQPNMAAAASQHPVSEDVAAHVPEDAAAPSVSANAPQSAAEDAAPYQDEEMPDFSGMSSTSMLTFPLLMLRISLPLKKHPQHHLKTLWKLSQKQLFKWMHHLPRLKRKRKVMTVGKCPCLFPQEFAILRVRQ